MLFVGCFIIQNLFLLLTHIYLMLQIYLTVKEMVKTFLTSVKYEL